MRMLASVCVLSLLCTLATSGADLGDDPQAHQKLPDYPKAIQKLHADILKLPSYVDEMKKVHAKFKGTPGTFQFQGDSLTQSAMYWQPLKDGGKNFNPQAQQAYDLMKGYMKPECFTWKGDTWGNEGGTTSVWARDNIDRWMKDINPECVILLFGHNDQDRKGTPEKNMADWEVNMNEVIQKNLDNGTVVIISTLPPRRNRRCDVYSEKMIKFAAKYKLPVSDILGEMISRRPTDYDGSAKQFAGIEKYEVPTILCGDGEHMSHPKALVGDYSEEALRQSGDNLHTYVTLLSYAEVCNKVFGVPLPPKGAAKPGTPAKK